MSDTSTASVDASADNKIIGFKRELKYITTVDADTGEVISHVKVRDKRKKLGVGWLALTKRGSIISARYLSRANNCGFFSKCFPSSTSTITFASNNPNS